MEIYSFLNLFLHLSFILCLSDTHACTHACMHTRKYAHTCLETGIHVYGHTSVHRVPMTQIIKAPFAENLVLPLTDYLSSQFWRSGSTQSPFCTTVQRLWFIKKIISVLFLWFHKFYFVLMQPLYLTLASQDIKYRFLLQLLLLCIPLYVLLEKYLFWLWKACFSVFLTVVHTLFFFYLHLFRVVKLLQADFSEDFLSEQCFVFYSGVFNYLCTFFFSPLSHWLISQSYSNHTVSLLSETEYVFSSIHGFPIFVDETIQFIHLWHECYAWIPL